MKNKLRTIALEKRKLINSYTLSIKIIDNLISTNEYKTSKNIIAYYPLKYEIDTKICFLDKTKNWFLPRVNDNILDICPFSQLQRGSFGIMEPNTNALLDYSIIDMIIIPACACDKNGYRLGYGKGYYDRFLPLLSSSCKKIVLTFSELLFDNIYPDKYDVKSDIIITEKEIIYT